jgi:hypothetical protein
LTFTVYHILLICITTYNLNHDHQDNNPVDRPLAKSERLVPHWRPYSSLDRPRRDEGLYPPLGPRDRAFPRKPVPVRVMHPSAGVARTADGRMGHLWTHHEFLLFCPRGPWLVLLARIS